MALWKSVCVLSLVSLMATGSNSQGCGVAAVNTKIIGGAEAKDGSWPWQASLHLNNEHVCGGTLINEQWVLTSARCYLKNKDVTKWTIYLGRHRQSGNNANQQSRLVTKIIPHDGYSNVSHENDLSLFQLNSRVSYNKFIQPICLTSSSSSIAEGTDSWVTGFGVLAVGGQLANTLQEVDVLVVSNSRCDKQYSTVHITDKMICAGVPQGGKDPCQGDSGSPLMHKYKSVWVQSGIVSFGDGCARPDTAGVYTRVSTFQGWITRRVTGTSPSFVNLKTNSASRPPFTILLSLLPVCLSIFVLSGWGQ